MPTRLIDLGVSQESQPRLVHSCHLKQRVPYCTLSHCWGTYRHAQVSKASLASFAVGIPVEALHSNTFQHAITITRQLGVRYLWIDSLCIVQDDHEDWIRESALMSKVYSRSLCTIAAAHAIDGREGCFSQRDPLVVFPVLVPSPFQASNSCRPRRPLFAIHCEKMNSIYESQVRSGPLYTRGWVVQERLISPRTLFFGKEQVVWHCKSHFACEAFPYGEDYVPLERDARKSVHRELVRIEGDRVELLQQWSAVVRTYTSSKLTTPGDKLVALQALATLFQNHTKDQYLAGLWLNPDLVWQLLWSIEPGSTQGQRPSDSSYRAPSWSWASVDGMIEMKIPSLAERRHSEVGMTYDQDVLIDIEDVWTIKENAKAAPNGPVTGGILRIRGQVFSAWMTRVSEDDLLGAVHEAELYDKKLTHPGEDSAEQAREIGMCLLDAPSECPADGFVDCLPIIGHKLFRNGRAGRGEWSLRGLLLLPRGPANTFVRVGMFLTNITSSPVWSQHPSDRQTIEIV